MLSSVEHIKTNLLDVRKYDVVPELNFLSE